MYRPGPAGVGGPRVRRVEGDVGVDDVAVPIGPQYVARASSPRRTRPGRPGRSGSGRPRPSTRRSRCRRSRAGGSRSGMAAFQGAAASAKTPTRRSPQARRVDPEGRRRGPLQPAVRERDREGVVRARRRSPRSAPRDSRSRPLPRTRPTVSPVGTRTENPVSVHVTMSSAFHSGFGYPEAQIGVIVDPSYRYTNPTSA